ncbi:MAG: arsenite methyltransferase [Desulfobacteraceae bacterium]|nr:arsenite methyltransferase [Desulfobacteraceae bacterium]
METRDKEEIRESVRESYGKIAKAGGVKTESSQTVSCCGLSDASAETSQSASCCGPTQISTEPIQTASCCGPADTANETDQSASCCGPSDFSVEKMSQIMGYTKEEIESVPEGANMALGCGNPVALASLTPGETVVDLGSGGGFDCFLAAKEVGENGKVIGVDMTPDMISKARRNAEKAGTSNVDFRLGEIESLPVADNSADLIMSNCVINLSPDKQSVYRDAYRVLKPGGRLAISDVLATAELPDEIRNDLALVGACVGGAATIEVTERLLKEAGFNDIKITPKDNSRDLIREWDPNKSKTGLDYVVSAYIEAFKPMDH